MINKPLFLKDFFHTFLYSLFFLRAPNERPYMAPYIFLFFFSAAPDERPYMAPYIFLFFFFAGAQWAPLHGSIYFFILFFLRAPNERPYMVLLIDCLFIYISTNPLRAFMDLYQYNVRTFETIMWEWPYFNFLFIIK